MFERTFIISCALILFGAIASIPAVISGNLIFICLLLAAIEIVFRIERESGISFSRSSRAAFATAPWIGFGAVFHVVHGEWDLQGVWIAVIAAPVTFVIMQLCQGCREGDVSKFHHANEQVSAGQPATLSESNLEDDQKLQADSEGRSR